MFLSTFSSCKLYGAEGDYLGIGNLAREYLLISLEGITLE